MGVSPAGSYPRNIHSLMHFPSAFFSIYFYPILSFLNKTGITFFIVSQLDFFYLTMNCGFLSTLVQINPLYSFCFSIGVSYFFAKKKKTVTEGHLSFCQHIFCLSLFQFLQTALPQTFFTDKKCFCSILSQEWECEPVWTVKILTFCPVVPGVYPCPNFSISRRIGIHHLKRHFHCCIMKNVSRSKSHPLKFLLASWSKNNVPWN